MDITTNVRALHVDRQGDLWIGVRGKGVMHVGKGTSEPHLLRGAPEMKAVTTIYEDAESNLWVGTDVGLLRITRRKFDIYTEHEGLTEDFIFPIHGDQRGGVWLGTWGGGVHRIQNGHLTTYTTEDGLRSNYIRTLHLDRDGHMWVGTTEGVTRLPEGEAYACPEGERWVRAILEDRAGTLWVGGNDFLARMTDRGLVRSEPEEFGRTTTVWALHEDRQGRLWVATRDGLFQKNGDRWIKYTTEDGLSSDFVVSIYEEKEGTLWFGTQGSGLNRFENGHFVPYTLQDGLHSAGVWGILEDDRGNFWMSSNSGIFRVSERELDAFAEGETDHITPVVYTEADGMPSAECNRGQPAAWKDQRGRLWFPTIKGAVIVDPDNVPRNDRPPPVHIERVFVNGRPIPQQGKNTFQPESENLKVHYTALSLTAPEENRFQYKLEGYDKRWTDAGTRRTAFYTNLPPGTYTFRVRAANNDGVWNEEGASFSFQLRPFFYETTWFYLLCMALLGIAGGGAYHYRIKHLREKELEKQVAERTRRLQEEKQKTEAQAVQLKKQAKRLKELDRMKSRFFANISHEFRTPLSMILGPVQDLLTGEDEAIEDEKHQQLEMVRCSAYRMERLIDQLLDLAELEAGQEELQLNRIDLIDFLREIVRSFAPMAERSRIRLDFRPEPDHLEWAFDAEKLSTVMSNLLSNALKFTAEEGIVRVTVAENAQRAVIRVRDTGPGIPEEEQSRIFDRFYQVDDSTTRAHKGTGRSSERIRDSEFDDPCAQGDGGRAITG